MHGKYNVKGREVPIHTITLNVVYRCHLCYKYVHLWVSSFGIGNIVWTMWSDILSGSHRVLSSKMYKSFIRGAQG
jgi:hypothetical protein